MKNLFVYLTTAAIAAGVSFTVLGDENHEVIEMVMEAEGGKLLFLTGSEIDFPAKEEGVRSNRAVGNVADVDERDEGVVAHVFG